MFLVALLTGSTDDAAAQARLAAATGVTTYEARLALAAGFPTIVLTTGDEAKARDLAAALRAGGDDAIACDTREVIAAEAMVPFDRFTFETNAGPAEGPFRDRSAGDGVVAAGQSLPYADILCLLRAIHRGRAKTETRTTERKFDIGKSLLSGGLANSKVVTKTSSEAAESREPVLYVFRRSGATPWLLREARTSYEGLGPARGLTATANFATTIRLLRERAPNAVYDERLVHAHRALERSSMQGTGAKSTVTSSFASGIDALAHLVALTLARA
jgi:hypothetical protein